jgi:hypothetical protein
MATSNGPIPEPAPAARYCTQCGEKNLENNFKCVRCGALLHAPPPAQKVILDDSSFGGLIPYKNAQALWAYYLGIFSLIPFLGIPLAVAAIVLGIRGLLLANKHPESKGRVHAWVGIILGGICGVGYTLLLTIIIIAALAH